jgi:hypothetical protein
LPLPGAGFGGWPGLRRVSLLNEPAHHSQDPIRLQQNVGLNGLYCGVQHGVRLAMNIVPAQAPA